MNSSDNLVAPKVLKRAIEISLQQGYLPISPCSIQSDTVSLCAAACLAYAGLEFISKQEAESFLTNLITHPSHSVLHKAYEKLSWPRVLCDELQAQNDITPLPNRLSVFISSCNSMAFA